MKLTKKCKKCDGTGKLPNPDFEYCAKLSRKDRERFGLTEGVCNHCPEAVRDDCKLGEFIECLHCEGTGRIEQVFDIDEEEDILDIILQHADLLTCFNCGTKLQDKSHPWNDLVGILHIEPGRSNYPREPDEPAVAYFECVECANITNKEKRKETIPANKEKLKTEFCSNCQVTQDFKLLDIVGRVETWECTSCGARKVNHTSPNIME